MPRKIRFFCPKNWERKQQRQKRQKQVVTTSQPMSPITSPPTASQPVSPTTSHPVSPTTSQPVSPTTLPPTTSHPLVSLQNSLTLPKSWIEQSPNPLDKVQICKLSSGPSSSRQPLVITHCLVIHSDLTWSLFVHNHALTPNDCPLLVAIPKQLTPESVKSFVEVLDRLTVCAGHPEKKFVKFLESKKGVLVGRNEKSVAHLDDYVPVTLNGETFSQTVRSVKCELLVPNGKCTVCKKYRSTLRVLSNRFNSRCAHDLSDSSSHSNIKFLNTPEKKARMSNLRNRARAAENVLKKLQANIQQLTEKYGECVNGQLHDDLVTIMKENSKHVDEVYHEGSFANLFWKEQMKAATLKDQRQMRWHPVIIRWCINLKLMSSAAYHATRTVGFIKLPSERTLRDYTHYYKHQAGYQVEVLKQLQKESKVEELPDNKKFCGVVIDEMKIREGLVYDKGTGEITGFSMLGDINTELSALEKQCQGENEMPEVAKHMLVIMIRGIFFKLDFPFAHFATGDLTGEQIFPIVWEAVRLVESIGLKVIFITADGASHNRKFFKMHKVGNEAYDASKSSDNTATSSTESNKKKCLTYRTRNRYAPEDDRWIYFISDAPHLIKTTRNCLQHSAFGGTHLMTRNSHYILWKHIKDVYEKTQAMTVASKGLSLLPKLMYEHIHLTSYSKMRVDLAAQILSTSMANALAYFGDPDTKETELFIRNFDRFFDCLNVRSMSECGLKRKDDLRPYTSPNDERLTWLEKSFLKYLDEWESYAQAQTKLSVNERRKLCLSEETLEGLRITVKSFVEMTKFVLSQSGTQGLFFLSERISQDPLENYFGKQRSRGSRSGNPNMKECLQNAVAIRAQKSLQLDRVQGNCRRKRLLGNDDFNVNKDDDTPMPKRKRRKQS